MHLFRDDTSVIVRSSFLRRAFPIAGMYLPYYRPRCMQSLSICLASDPLSISPPCPAFSSGLRSATGASVELGSSTDKFAGPRQRNIRSNRSARMHACSWAMMTDRQPIDRLTQRTTRPTYVHVEIDRSPRAKHGSMTRIRFTIH